MSSPTKLSNSGDFTYFVTSESGDKKVWQEYKDNHRLDLANGFIKITLFRPAWDRNSGYIYSIRGAFSKESDEVYPTVKLAKTAGIQALQQLLRLINQDVIAIENIQD